MLLRIKYELTKNVRPEEVPAAMRQGSPLC